MRIWIGWFIGEASTYECDDVISVMAGLVPAIHALLRCA
jgi:hypothetical protein